MAESIGLEPMHRLRDDRLAICCITTLPTLHQVTDLYLYDVFPSVNSFFNFSAFSFAKIKKMSLFQHHGDISHEYKTEKDGKSRLLRLLNAIRFRQDFIDNHKQQRTAGHGHA